MEHRHPLTEFRLSRTPVLTQEALGAQLGVDKSTVSRWEAGYPIPSERLRRVSEITGIPVDRLLPPPAVPNAAGTSAGAGIASPAVSSSARDAA